MGDLGRGAVGDLSRALPATPIGHVPAELTSFVGRRAELHSIGATLGAARLVTLTGPGGCGKSRLAVRVARRRGGEWRDGAWWVDLSSETDGVGVPGRVASAVGVLLTSDVDATVSLARQVQEQHLLVILDNCEHLLAAAADLVGALLQRCPGVTVLATSREPLGVPGEVVWRVPPLDSHDAVALFTDRGGSALDDDAAAAVRRICARLDRLPLALELAAAWTGTLSPQEIVAELDDRFRMLVTGRHGVPPRHQTLAASMAWSHDLLAERDRVLFRRLGVFQAGFTLKAAQGVCAFDGLDNADILVGLRRLIDKSLLTAETRDGVARYRMLETVRHYALARLAEAGEGDAVRRRHLATYLALAQQAAPLLDTDKDAWRARMHADYPNLRAAIEWGLSLDDVEGGRRLAASMAWLWHLEGRRAEGLSLLRLAAARGDGEHSALQARVLAGLALVADTTRPIGYDFDVAGAAREMALAHGDARTACLAGQLTAIGLLGRDLDAVRAQAAQTRQEAIEAGDGFVADAAHVLMGLVCFLRDEHHEALALLGPAVVGLTGRRDRGVAAMALGVMALSTAYGGDLPRAHELAGEAVEVAQPLADFHRVGTARSVLARICALQGRTQQAKQALDPVVRLVDQADSVPYIPGLAWTVGLLHMRDGRPDLAIRWFRSETSWWDEAASDDHLMPDTRIALAAALRVTADRGAAGHNCEGALATARALGAPRLIADALEQKARLLEETDPDRASVVHHEALGLRVGHGLRLGCLDSLDAVAASAAHRGYPAVAARLLGAADRGREDLAYPRSQPDVTLRADLARALGEAAHDQAVAEGRTMGLDEALAFARRARTARRRPDHGWASLTSTEREVVRLAIDGLTNPEIGKRLFMSRSTVKTHLGHVYAKLGVANRTELASSATRAKTPH